MGVSTLAPDGCLLLIDKLDELPASTIDTSTYHEIWRDTVAIQGMCVRYNRQGRVVGAGKPRYDSLMFR
jgi:hypothetical protein